MIDEYRFGKIQIDGKIYDYDIELRWDGQVLKWSRKESHIIDLEDVVRAIEQSPDIIIIGTGANGIAQVTERARQAIENYNIKTITDITPVVIEAFNVQQQLAEKGKSKKIIGLFHLTC